MSGIAVGANKGFPVQKRALKKSSRKWYMKLSKDERKGRAPGKRTKVVREVVRATVGYAPYERRMMEILKGGGSNPQKKAWRFARNRLGTMIRAKKKLAEMERVVTAGPAKTAKKTAKKAAKNVEKKSA